MLELDLLVIGTGPAGQRAAVQAAKLGKTVGIAERREVVGGVCINTGTIPSKTFREAVLYLTGFQQRGFYGSGYHLKESVSMPELLQRVDQVVQREIQVIGAQMARNRVRLIQGETSFVGPHDLIVRGTAQSLEVRAERVVIATGTVPALPEGVPEDGHTVITSDGVLGLKEIPRTLTVVGAGVIGVEYASMFAALGVEVTLVDRRDRLLDFVDAEIAESLSHQMRAMGCTFRLSEDIDTIAVEGPRRTVATLRSGKRVVSDLLLYATGRIGATAALNLPAAGLQADERGRIKVNERFETSVAHILAVGDVIGFPSLASTSMEQGRRAVCYAYAVSCSSLPELFPYGIYSIPEISMVGRNEAELTEAGVPYEIGVARYREIARGAILGDDSGLLKMLFHRQTRAILGVHIIGTSATELVHIGQAVIAFGGTIDYFVDAVLNYPTFAECYKVAALDGYNKVGPPPGGAPPPGSGLHPPRNT